MSKKYTVLEQYYLQGYNATQPIENHLMFRRNISPPSLGQNTPSMKPARKQVARALFSGFTVQLILQS
jgi:hypothetical protein